METIELSTRFSGAPWISDKEITLIGAGGIGSWTALALARCGFPLVIIDFDDIEPHNLGGQFYSVLQQEMPKTTAIRDNILRFCPSSNITVHNARVDESLSVYGDIMICAVDNMKARKLLFKSWLTSNSRELFVDGRLTMELFEIFAVYNDETIARYKENLFDDEESNVVPCNAQQTTFSAMGIASFIAGTVCNHIVNGTDTPNRIVPFYQKMFYPLFLNENQF